MIRDLDSEEVYDLGAKQIQRGLQLMADQGFLNLGAVLNGCADPHEADVFVQMCLFGEVVYG